MLQNLKVEDKPIKLALPTNAVCKVILTDVNDSEPENRTSKDGEMFAYSYAYRLVLESDKAQDTIRIGTDATAEYNTQVESATNRLRGFVVGIAEQVNSKHPAILSMGIVDTLNYLIANQVKFEVLRTESTMPQEQGGKTYTNTTTSPKLITAWNNAHNAEPQIYKIGTATVVC